MAVGDWVLSIDGESAGNLTHIEAQNKIRACGERLSLGLSRYRADRMGGEGSLWPDPPAVTAFSLSPEPSLSRANHRR